MIKTAALIASLASSMPAQQEGLRLVPGFSKGNISVIHCANLPYTDLEGKPVCVNAVAYVPLLAMIKHAAQDGYIIKINYGYRDKQQQKRLYRQSHRMAAKPGHSNHQSGMSVDIAGTRECKGRRCTKTALFQWLVTHAPMYGFINTIPKEPWHFTYMGRSLLWVGIDIDHY